MSGWLRRGVGAARELHGLMLQRVCTRHGKVGCECGKKVAWAGSTRRKRLPRNWHKIRKRVLDRDPLCSICGYLPSTVCDHRAPGDDHSDSNLQGICEVCDRVKSSKEGNAAQRGNRVPRPPVPSGGPSLLIALVGAAGSGKTQVAHALQRKGYRYRSIDDCGNDGHAARWTRLLEWIDEQDGAEVVVESNVIPPALADRLKTRQGLVAELVVEEKQRRRQLQQRGSYMKAVDVGYPVDVQVSHPGADAEIVRAVERKAA